MSKDRSTWTAASRPAPIVVMAGAYVLLASSGLFLINALPLFDLTTYPSEFSPNERVVVVVLLAVISMTWVLTPLLAAIFALRGSRWPAFLAAGFAILITLGVVGAHPIYIAGAFTALVGAALLWLPKARGYARTTMQDRRSDSGLIKPKKPVT